MPLLQKPLAEGRTSPTPGLRIEQEVEDRDVVRRQVHERH